MPNIALSLIDTLKNVSAAPAASASETESTGFQSLLDISAANTNSAAADDRSGVKDERKDERDIVAVPVTQPASPPVEPRRRPLDASPKAVEDTQDGKRDVPSSASEDNEVVSAGTSNGEQAAGFSAAAAQQLAAASRDAVSADDNGDKAVSAFVAQIAAQADVMLRLLSQIPGASGSLAEAKALSSALPTELAPHSVDAEIKNVWQLLQTIAEHFSLGDQTALSLSGASTTDRSQALLPQLQKFLQDAFALFNQYESGKIDGDALLGEIKPVLDNIQRILTGLERENNFKATAFDLPFETVLGSTLLTTVRPTPVAADNTQAEDKAIALQHAVNALAATAVAESAAGNNAGDRSGANTNLNQTPLSITPLRTADAAQKDASVRAAPFARLLGQTAKAPVAEQVVFHIKTALADGSSRIRIQLEPADLGKLDIRLHVGADGKTGVNITIDNKSTLEMLQRDTQGLQRALADAGLTTDSGNLNFNLRGDQRQAQDQASQAAQSYQSALPEGEEEALPVATSRSYVINLTEGLDITI